MLFRSDVRALCTFFFFEYLSFFLHNDRDALRDGVWRDRGRIAEARHERRAHMLSLSTVYYYTTVDTYLTVFTNHTVLDVEQIAYIPTIHISPNFCLPTFSSRVPRTTRMIILLSPSQFVPSCVSQILHSRAASPLRLPH